MVVCVLGCGNSGLGMAAHLISENVEVKLWNRSDVRISEVLGGAPIAASGVISGHFKPSIVTTDLELAVSGASLIIITIPSNGHVELAEQLAQLEIDLPPIILSPGRTFGRVLFVDTLGKNNRNVPYVGECQTVLHTCRALNSYSVHFFSIKNQVLLAGKDFRESREIIDLLPKPLSSFYEPAESQLITSLSNVGMILHCIPMLLNVGWVENPSISFMYYRDGISPGISRLLEKLDAERLAVASKLGVKVDSLKEWLNQNYQVPLGSLYDMLQANIPYQFIEAPKSMEHRYLTEDLSTGLVRLEKVASELGVEVPTCSLFIQLACELFEIDWREPIQDVKILDII